MTGGKLKFPQPLANACRLVLCFSMAILCGCTTSTVSPAVRRALGMRTEPHGRNSLAGIDIWLPRFEKRDITVLDIPFEQALVLTYEAARGAYHNVSVEYMVDRSGVAVINAEGLLQHRIRPRIVENKLADNDYGILFEALSASYSGRLSPPSYSTTRDFEDSLATKLGLDPPTKVFEEYTVSPDAGVPERVGPDIPLAYESFKAYLDARGALSPFEGIWTESNGLYTLGLLRTPNDARYRYKAFVIGSRRASWEPGEIKAHFADIQPGKITTGEYGLHSKGTVGSTWQAERELIKGNTALANLEVLLVKEYPRGKAGDFLTGVGTGWVVATNGIFVTNAHVIDGASRILVGSRTSDPREARVLARDDKLDLAILQVMGSASFIPIPLADQLVPNGSRVTVLGFPLAFDLGEEVKVTDGIISAQSGLQSDVTQYQISAPLQHGNSGGPVIDEFGRVVGIAVATFADENLPGTQDPELVNYAIKSAYLFPLLDLAGTQISPSTAKGPAQRLSPAQISERYSSSIQPVWTER